MIESPHSNIEKMTNLVTTTATQLSLLVVNAPSAPSTDEQVVQFLESIKLKDAVSDDVMTPAAVSFHWLNPITYMPDGGYYVFRVGTPTMSFQGNFDLMPRDSKILVDFLRRVQVFQGMLTQYVGWAFAVSRTSSSEVEKIPTDGTQVPTDGLLSSSHRKRTKTKTAKNRKK